MSRTRILLCTALGIIALAIPLKKAFSTNGAFYTASIGPTWVTPGSTTQYAITVTNDLQTGGGNTNSIHIVRITTPKDFTYNGITLPPYWAITSVSGTSASGVVITLKTPN